MVFKKSQPKPAARSEVSIAIKSAKTENKNQQQQDCVLPLQEIGKDREERQQRQNPLPERNPAQGIQRPPQQQRDREEHSQVQQVPKHKGFPVWQESQRHEKQSFEWRVNVGQRPLPDVGISCELPLDSLLRGPVVEFGTAPFPQDFSRGVIDREIRISFLNPASHAP